MKWSYYNWLFRKKIDKCCEVRPDAKMLSVMEYIGTYIIYLPGALCNIGYPNEMHLKPKFRKVSSVHNLFCICPIISEFFPRARQFHCRALCQSSEELCKCAVTCGQAIFRGFWFYDQIRVDVLYFTSPGFFFIWTECFLVIYDRSFSRRQRNLVWW